MNNRIDDGDLAYHAKVVASIRQAQQMELQVQDLARRIAAAHGEAAGWNRHLSEKYQLGPGDAIDEAGAIVRKAA